MNKRLRALIVEDDVNDAARIARELGAAGYELLWECVSSEAEYVKRLRLDIDIILSDYKMPNFSGPRALALLRESGIDVPFILISGCIGEETAVAQMRDGAADYLLKDRLTRLGLAVDQALARCHERKLTARVIEQALGRLNDAQRIGRIGDWDFNIKANAITWSPQVYEIVGRDPKLGPPRDLADAAQIYEPTSRALMHRKIAQALSSGEAQEYELVGHRPDGERFDVRAMAVPRKDESGRVIGLYGTLQDITDGVKASTLLAQSQRRLALATESAKIGIWDLNVDSNKLVWDTRMYELYGIREQDFSGAYDAWKNGLHPADRTRAEAELAAALHGDRAFHTEFRVVWPDGDERDIEAHALVQRASDGSPRSMIGVNWDITDRKRAELRIGRLNRVYAVLSSINSLIVRTLDQEELFGEACEIAVVSGRFKMAWIGLVDPKAMTIIAVASAGVQPQMPELSEDCFRLAERSSLRDGSNTARAVRDKNAVVINEICGDTTMVLTKECLDREIYSMAILPLVVCGEVAGVLELYSDEVDFFDAEELRLLEELASDIAFAMDHIEKQKRLDYLAYYDVLTGLANSNLLLKRLAQDVSGAESSGHTFALVLIDLERFKMINHSLGRSAGDELLKQFAEWLVIRVPDASVLARVGADQFAVVIPRGASQVNEARQLQKAIDALLEHPFPLNDGVFRIAAKVGVALFPEDGTTAEGLLKNGEAALQNAKVTGARWLRYTSRLTDDLVGRLTLENQLRQAVAREEFVLHYQPKVSLVSGKVTGAEALIRWNHPSKGMVPPGEFIPLLEETGLIFEAGRWALNKAVEDYLRWRRAGLPVVRIAVNVSPLQLRDGAFASEVERVVGIEANASAGLELEITESLIMENIKLSVATLEEIRALGVTVAIDDFGTGFSSLSHLAKLPVDTLKIDRAFVNDLTSGAQGLALVSTIVNLAHSLSLKVVAEGVETEEQIRVLRSLSCDEMQGYRFSKPVSGEVFEARFLGSIARRTES